MTALDLAAGYRALVEDVAAVVLDRDVVRISGPDAESYLQGQVSQDVVALDPGASAWSLVLQPQGKVDAWVRITRIAGDDFMLDVDAGWGDALVARLTRFKLRVKADIESLAWGCVALRGPAAAVRDGGQTLVAPAAWPLIGGVDLLGPDVRPPDGVGVAPIEAYEVRRIEAGMPRMGAELTERTIPAEANVVPSSVSFTKGCYTGQELVARIDSRGGNVPRRILGVTIEAGTLPAAGDALTIGDREVGTLTSVAAHPDGHGVGLALVRRDVDPPADAVSAGVPTIIRALPLLS